MSIGSKGTKSVSKVFGNIFISFIGAGVLGLPYAFKEAGVLEGIAIMSLVGYLSMRAMFLLIDCKDYMEANKQRMVRSTSAEHWAMDESKTASFNKSDQLLINKKPVERLDHDIGYGDVGYCAYGRIGSTLVDVAIVVSQTGFCCAYLIFITENVEEHFSSQSNAINSTSSNKNEIATTFRQSILFEQYIMFILLLPLCFLCFLRRLHKLAVFSIFADFANIFAYSIVFWFDFEESHTVSVHPKKMDLDGLPFFAGMAVYCYEGAGMILSLEGSMADEIRPKFRGIFRWAMVLITTLYILFGVCGYLSFGEETDQIITLNLPQGVFPLLVKLCLCLSLFFTYPVMMFPVVQIIEKRFKKRFVSVAAGNILRAGMVLGTGFIVMIIPSFSTLMSLVGAVCCSPLAFILPSLFHMKIFKNKSTKLQRLLNYVLIIFGISASFIGTMDSLKRLGIVYNFKMDMNSNAVVESPS